MGQQEVCPETKEPVHMYHLADLNTLRAIDQRIFMLKLQINMHNSLEVQQMLFMYSQRLTFVVCMSQIDGPMMVFFPLEMHDMNIISP